MSKGEFQDPVFLQYFCDIQKYPLLTLSEEHSLSAKAQKGDREALDKLVTSNLRLVIVIAKEYLGRGVSLMDLINEGNLGLHKGCQKYKPNKGTKISTYTAYWIKQYMRRYICNHMLSVRVPVHLQDKRNRANRMMRNLESSLGRAPTLIELSGETGFTVKNLEKMLERNQEVSLDAEMFSRENDCEQSSMYTILEDDNALVPGASLELSEKYQFVYDMISVLTKQEKEVMERRYGLNGYRVHTLDEVGKKFGVTRERIRQIQAKTLRTLRRRHSKQQLN